jgi:hypothetical protein
MPSRREQKLPKLPISLEALPLPESKRTRRLMLSFTDAELAMIEKASRHRGDQPAVLCRTIILTAFQNSAARALAERPGLMKESPAEQLRALLEVFAVE